MENQNLVYTTYEAKMLNDLKNIENVKRSKKLSFILSIFWLGITIKDIFKVPTITSNVFFIIVFLLFDLFFVAMFFTRFIVCKNVITKHACINNPKTNPLSLLCEEKISECKNLIQQGKGYYAVQKKYLELREFLDNYGDLLPKETLLFAQAELQKISSDLMHCELKR